MSTDRAVAREEGRAHVAGRLDEWHDDQADEHAEQLIAGLWRLGWRPRPELRATTPIPQRPRQASPAVREQAMAQIRAAFDPAPQEDQ